MDLQTAEGFNSVFYLHSSCCSGDGMNWTATRLGQFHAHLDSHRNRGDFVPEEYYELELN